MNQLLVSLNVKALIVGIFIPIIMEAQSPYKFSLKNEVPYIVSGMSLMGIGVMLKNKNADKQITIEDIKNLDISNVNSFDRVAVYNNSYSARKASDVLQYGSLGLPILFLTINQSKKDFLKLIVMGIEVHTINSGLTLTAKQYFGRARPLVYNPEFSIEERTSESARLSFFSGHTSSTAAMTVFTAKVINDYHPNMNSGLKLGMWSTALIIPAATGYFRVQGGKHFATDVITGFAVGSMVGWLVPHLHKVYDNSRISLVPMNYSGYNGFYLSCKI